MNKKELIIAAAAKSGLSQKDTAAALQALTTTIVSAVSKGVTADAAVSGVFSRMTAGALYIENDPAFPITVKKDGTVMENGTARRVPPVTRRPANP